MARTLQCTGRTKKGLRCGNAAVPGSFSCSIAAHCDQRLLESDWLLTRQLPAKPLQCLALNFSSGRCPNPAQPEQKICRPPKLQTLGPFHRRGNLTGVRTALVETPAPLANSLDQLADEHVDLAGLTAFLQKPSGQLAEAKVKSRLKVLQKTVPILPVAPEG